MSTMHNNIPVSSATIDNGFAPPAEPSLAMGVIGNCAFSALIDKRGRIVWCCLPRFDEDPVFNALIDQGKSGADRHAPNSASQPGAFAIEIENLHATFPTRLGRSAAARLVP